MTFPKKKWTALIAGVAAMTLFSACTNGDDAQPTDTPAAPLTTEAPPTDPTPDDSPTTNADRTPSDTPAGGDDNTTTGTANIDAGFAAVALAESEVADSSVISLDLDEDGTWQVDVIAADTKHELQINAEGTEVLEREQDDADSDDTRRLNAVKVSLDDAVRTALAEVDGTFDQVELDDHNDTVVWEVEVDTPAGDDVSVYVDVATGEVIGRS